MNKTSTEVRGNFVQWGFLKPVYTEQNISALVWVLDGSTVHERLPFDKGAMVKIECCMSDQTVQSLGKFTFMLNVLSSLWWQAVVWKGGHGDGEDKRLHGWSDCTKPREIHLFVKYIIVAPGCPLMRRPWWWQKVAQLVKLSLWHCSAQLFKQQLAEFTSSGSPPP